ncbi:putative HTH-type transcriptional regulator YdfH [Aquisphaera giovannonii]|uniref:Putative HTH-type transcriptional regulator YdfH n=1 Tax=Aquisphaera giovannonii TaxID=406548 RepID=A0A5B9WCT2_9BACT|nr:GntR family transcriptional regulator [Aquisphaera giovannonii]QEH38416.1 putative HTH-type transcriptional regulator YdfH [Aquisphaera giovannonii]
MASEGDGRFESPLSRMLREDILTGRLQAGSRLTEAELSSRFGVGRGLVREAVQALSSQGLLISRPNRGAVVAPEAPREIRNLIIPIRRTVEVYALRLVFDELGEADFAAWRRILDRMRGACARRDFHAIAEADLAFHRQLLERAGQPDLIVIWETLVGRIRSHFRKTQKLSADAMEIYEEHRAILESFRGRDLDAAVRLLKEKIA